MTFLQTLWDDHKMAIIAAGVALVAAGSCLKVVDEKTQAVVVRLGQPDRVINRFKPNADFGQTGAGIVWRIPFMEQVVEVDKRIL
ncbi:MAG: hypothetical protein RIS85_1463, partial [Pseudomonadota bacterium]